MNGIIRPFSACLTLLSVFVLSGCGNSESGDTAANSSDTELLEELLGPSVDPAEESQQRPSGSANRTSEAAGSSRIAAVSRSPGYEVSRRNSPKGDRLELKLRAGDRFPLIKTIEQKLEQQSEIAPARALTKLQMTMVISVEDVTETGVLLNVMYRRINYSHDVNGQQVVFDSDRHQGDIPWDAIPYAGMIDNGFSFWLGRDNRIQKLVGYQEFLERCVARVPMERRETLLGEISNRFGDDGVANFVDDSIALLPYDATVDADSATRVLPGDVWTRERRLMQPVPVHLKSTYRLISMDDQRAEIEISGRISSGDTRASDGAGRLRVTGGQSLGHCTVDCATGLPIEVDLTRYITMRITTADQQEVTQQKTILTSIRSFPEMKASVTSRKQPPAIRQVQAQSNLDDGGAVPIPSNNAPGAVVRAVYPD
jgi:hypothetical protein